MIDNDLGLAPVRYAQGNEFHLFPVAPETVATVAIVGAIIFVIIVLLRYD